MRKSLLNLAVLAASLFSAVAVAGDIQVDRATVRATAPGQETAMGDLHIVSKQAAKLVAVSTPAAQSVELHHMSTEQGVMRMREVSSVALPAGQPVDLGASGYHLMLMGLKQPIQVGTTVPFRVTVQLTNKKTVQLDVSAEVTPMIAVGGEMSGHEHMHHHH